METKTVDSKGAKVSLADPGNMTRVCQRCTNQYVLVWLKQGDNYNDFGDRHCPFCGLCTDEITGSVLV